MHKLDLGEAINVVHAVCWRPSRIPKQSSNKTEKTKGKLSFLIRLNQYAGGLLNIRENFLLRSQVSRFNQAKT